MEKVIIEQEIEKHYRAIAKLKDQLGTIKDVIEW